MQKFQQRKGKLREQIENLDLEIEKLKQERKSREHHIAVKSLPEEDRLAWLFVLFVKLLFYNTVVLARE